MSIESEIQDYQITNVYRNVDDATRQRIIQFWRDNDLANSNEEHIDDRIKIVAQIVELDGQIVGIASALVVKSNANDNLLYQYRMFIQEEHRSPQLRESVVLNTYELLKSWEPKALPKKPVGVMTVGLIPGIQDLGWKAVGKSTQGAIIFLRKF